MEHWKKLEQDTEEAITTPAMVAWLQDAVEAADLVDKGAALDAAINLAAAYYLLMRVNDKDLKQGLALDMYNELRKEK